MVYVVEYINHKPTREYSFSGVSAGLEFIEQQENIYKDRTYRITDRRINLTETNGSKIKFP